MKQNKFIYLIIFSLVFLGFTNGVKAGCCYESTSAGGYKKYEYTTSVPDDKCTQAYPYTTNPKVSDEASCLAKNADYNDYITHQCCNSSGDIKTGATKNNCSSTTQRDYQWRTVYECAALKKVCCENNAEYPSMKDENSCLAYGRNKYGANNNKVSWTYKASCVGLTADATIKAIEEIDQGNQFVTPPQNTPSTATNTSDPDGNSAGNGSTSATSGSTGSDNMTVGFDCSDPDVYSLVKTIKTIYNFLRYATPVILIIMGSIDFAKAVVAGKDDEIEKNKKKFMNRLFIAFLIFLLLSIFQLVTNIISSSGAANSNSWIDCWNK